MGKRGTLVLAVLVAGLLAYVLIFERGSLTSGELAARKGRALSSFVRDKVDRLEVQRKGATVVLAREPGEDGQLGNWKLLAPVQGKADQDEVDRVLGELEWLDARRTLTLSGEDAKTFGLAKPRYRVRYHAGQSNETLLIGNEEPRHEGVYAKLASAGDAMVVPKTLLEALDHAPGHYRDKELVGTITVPWARKIELVSAADHEVIEQRDGRWVETGAFEPLVDPKQLGAMLERLDDLRATRFLEGSEEQQALAALEAPERSVHVVIAPDEGREDKGTTRVELAIGGACPGHEGERVARLANGPPVCLKSEDVGPLMLSREALRQKQPWSEGPSEIEAFEIKTGASTLKLKRAGEAWKAEGGESSPDRGAVEAWLRDVGSLESSSLTKVLPFEAATQITLWLGDGKKRVLSIGIPGMDERVPVRRDQEGATAYFPRELADRVALHPRRFGPLALWRHQPSEVTKVNAQSGAFARELVLVDGTFRRVGENPALADEGRVRDLLRDVVKVEALGFITDRGRPEHGFATPEAKLRLGLASNENALELSIGAASTHGRYALAQDGFVYEVGKETLERIRELAGGPRPAPEKAADAEELEGEEDHDHEHGPQALE